MSNSAGMVLDYGVVCLIVFGSVLIPLFISRKPRQKKGFVVRIMKYAVARKLAASIMILCIIIIGCLGLILLKYKELDFNAFLLNAKETPLPS